jgi:hypothetical protein
MGDVSSLKVELVPDLDHCIETLAKKEHADVSTQLLEAGQRNKELEEKLEILRLFLETADFKKLRAESEKSLIEGRRVKFLVYLDNGVKYAIEVT